MSAKKWFGLSMGLAGAFIAGAGGVLALIGLQSPQNYDDCILRYVKAGMSTTGVELISKSCYQSHPREEAARFELATDDDMKRRPVPSWDSLSPTKPPDDPLAHAKKVCHQVPLNEAAKKLQAINCARLTEK